MRIVDDPAQLDQAYETLRVALAAWAGPGAHQWRSQSALEPSADGASFARRDDLHLYLERTADKLALGVALTEKDADLLRVEFMRDAPARRKRRAAIATDADGRFHLLLSQDLLADQDIRDPLKRLAGAPLVKGAEIGGRNYVLLGPFDAPRVADGLAAVAGLSTGFQRHIARLGDLAADEDERMKDALYPISRNVARAHKVHRRVITALHERLSGAGYQDDEARTGPLVADFAMSHGAETLVFEVRADAELSDLVRGIGQLALAAPRGAALTRIFVLPAPRDNADAALAPFMPTLEELGVSVLFYDIRNDALEFRFDRVDPEMSAAARELFA